MFHNFAVGLQSRICKSSIAICALIIATMLPWSNHLKLRLGEKSRRYSNRQDNLMNAARGKYTRDEMMIGYHVRGISKYRLHNVVLPSKHGGVGRPVDPTYGG